MKVRFHVRSPTREYFLLLLPLFFVFHGYVEVHRLVQAADTLSLFAFYCAVSFALAGTFFLIFRSWRKAALFSFCLLAIHFFFGSFHDTIKRLLGDVFLTKYSFLLVLVAVTIMIAFFYLRRSKKSFDKGVRYLNALFLLLVLIDAVVLAVSISRSQKEEGLPFGLSPCADCPTPDIYWIVADEYAGRQELADLFQYDNKPFENALKSRGFHIVDNTRSNYNFTPFSIASTMNLSYLPLRDTGRTIGDVPVVMELVRTNVLTRFLEKQGYSIVNHSVFDLPGQPQEVSSSFLPNKTKYITAQTLLSRLERDLYFHLRKTLKLQWLEEKSVYNNLRSNQTLYRNTINTSTLNKGPRFVYTHLSMPHPPYYYNEFGQPYAFSELVKQDDEKHYVGYLKYTNKKLLALVDQILKNSSKPPIILLTSDHGLRSGGSRYHFMNLCAVYSPGQAYTSYYDGMSMVNLYRVLLRDQFRQQLPLLEDRTYFLKD